MDGYQNTYNVIIGNSIILQCPVTESNPPAAYSWTFKNVSISSINSDYVLHKDGSLEIPSAAVDDDGKSLEQVKMSYFSIMIFVMISGVYTCMAKNVAGFASAGNILLVYVPPTITGPSAVTVRHQMKF